MHKLIIRASAVLAMAAFALVCPVPAGAMPQMLFLLRHAEKASTTDPDSPLSAAGLKRADLLRKMFGESGISAIYVTEYIRTQQTAQPLAEKLGLSAIKVKAAEIDQLVGQLRRSSDKVALVVAHSKSLPRLIEALGGGKIPDIAETDYSHFYLLVFSEPAGPTLVTLRYGDVTSPVAQLGSPAPSGNVPVVNAHAKAWPRLVTPRQDRVAGSFVLAGLWYDSSRRRSIIVAMTNDRNVHSPPGCRMNKGESVRARTFL